MGCITSNDDPTQHRCLTCQRTWTGPVPAGSSGFAHDNVGCHPIPAGATLYRYECRCGTKWEDIGEQPCPRCGSSFGSRTITIATRRLDDGRGFSTKRHHKCEVCFMIWDRAPDGGQCTGTEGGAPCPGCGRRPGKNTSVSCAGCASENVNVWVRPRADAPDVCLCPACAEERDFHEAKAKSVLPVVSRVRTRPAADYPVREGIDRVVARELIASRMGPIRHDDPPASLSAMNGDSGGTYKLPPGEAHLFKSRTPRPWLATFDLKAIAQSLFATDPRIQAIVGRVTETKAPRFTKKARMEREKEEHPLYVWSAKEGKALGLDELEKAVASLSGSSCGYILPAEQSDVEILGPTDTPRQRRRRAFDAAWKNAHGGKVERAARHDAIRRAIAIWRGLPR